MAVRTQLFREIPDYGFLEPPEPGDRVSEWGRRGTRLAGAGSAGAVRQVISRNRETKSPAVITQRGEIGRPACANARAIQVLQVLNK